MVTAAAESGFLEGVRLFNEGKFFEAHDAWEKVWYGASGVERDFFQGLIQAAVALVHYERGNARGVVNLYGSYREKFQGVPEGFMGVHVAEFLVEMEALLRPVVAQNPLPGRGEISLDRTYLPRIEIGE